MLGSGEIFNKRRGDLGVDPRERVHRAVTHGAILEQSDPLVVGEDVAVEHVQRGQGSRDVVPVGRLQFGGERVAREVQVAQARRTFQTSQFVD